MLAIIIWIKITNLCWNWNKTIESVWLGTLNPFSPVLRVLRIAFENMIILNSRSWHQLNLIMRVSGSPSFRVTMDCIMVLGFPQLQHQTKLIWCLGPWHFFVGSVTLNVSTKFHFHRCICGTLTLTTLIISTLISLGKIIASPQFSASHFPLWKKVHWNCR